MKKKIGFIVVPVIIILIIGMWFLKNRKPDNEKIENSVQQENQSSSQIGLADEDGVSTDGQNEEVDEAADFSLETISMIDYEVLAEYGLPIFVDYGSDSCIPCKQMAPVLEKMNEEMQGKAFVKFVDVWKYPEAAQNVPVQVIPTQVLFNADGTPFVPSDELAEKIQFDMYSSKDTGEHVFTVHQGGITEEEMRLILAEMGVSD